MVSQDLIKKIRHLEITTRRLLNGTLVGDSRSAIKGSGFEFDQIRDYQLGDDIRFIDWASSLRMQKMLVKQYFEERNRTIIIALDVSSSGLFSSSDEHKLATMAQVACVLALVAEYGKDAVGLLLFSDTVELYLPPSRGKAHVHELMRKVMGYVPEKGKKTNITVALDYLASLPTTRATVFLLSDCIDHNDHQLEKAFKIVGKKYETTVIRCLDVYETTLPAIGMITLEDAETGQTCMVHMDGSKKSRMDDFLQQRLQWQRSLFKKCTIDHLDIAVHKPFMDDLIKFFCKRMMY